MIQGLPLVTDDTISLRTACAGGAPAAKTLPVSRLLLRIQILLIGFPRLFYELLQHLDCHPPVEIEVTKN